MPEGPKPHFIDRIIDPTTGKEVVAENSAISIGQELLVDFADRNTIVDDETSEEDFVIGVSQFRGFIGVDSCPARP